MSVPPNDLASHPTDFVALLRRRAIEHGDARGFTYRSDDGSTGDTLTFATLDRKARAIASRLQAAGMAGRTAVLLFPPGLDFLPAFFGCLYAGTIPVPAYPPRPRRPSPRLETLFADARPGILLGQASLLEGLDARIAPFAAAGALARLATDLGGEEGADDWVAPAIRPDSVAFLQYTSGSTARPKGVVITHGNLMANSAAIRDCFGSDPGSTGVFWLPLYHDMGLIGGILQTIYCGGSSELLAPASFLQRPARWLESITRTGASISGGPNFAFDLCARKVTEEQKATLDLSGWRVAFNGAEPIHPETLDRFVEAFAPCGFRREAFLPCYGLAESTLLIAGGGSGRPPVTIDVRRDPLAQNEAIEAAPGDLDARRLVGSGRIMAGQSVLIVDPDAAVRLPDGRVGEIWVQGPSVAAGYWNRPEASEATFGARLAADADSGPFLRSGDLGFFLDGELFVTGRIKDLIIIRGRNIYPQDVERTVGDCHPSLAPESCAVFAVEGEGEPRLVVVQEAGRREKDLGAVLASIRRAVAGDHELELGAVVLIRPTTLLKTSSGKVQRNEIARAYEAGTLEVLGSWAAGSVAAVVELAGDDPIAADRPRAEVEAWLAAKLAALLGIRAEEVDPRKPFAEFGLGSLRAVELAAEMERWLGRPLAPTLLYDHPTVEARPPRWLAGRSRIRGRRDLGPRRAGTSGSRSSGSAAGSPAPAAPRPSGSCWSTASTPWDRCRKAGEATSRGRTRSGAGSSTGSTGSTPNSSGSRPARRLRLIPSSGCSSKSPGRRSRMRAGPRSAGRRPGRRLRRDLDQ